MDYEGYQCLLTGRYSSLKLLKENDCPLRERAVFLDAHVAKPDAEMVRTEYHFSDGDMEEDCDGREVTSLRGAGIYPYWWTRSGAERAAKAWLRRPERAKQLLSYSRYAENQKLAEDQTLFQPLVLDERVYYCNVLSGTTVLEIAARLFTLSQYEVTETWEWHTDLPYDLVLLELPQPPEVMQAVVQLARETRRILYYRRDDRYRHLHWGIGRFFSRWQPDLSLDLPFLNSVEEFYQARTSAAAAFYRVQKYYVVPQQVKEETPCPAAV